MNGGHDKQFALETSLTIKPFGNMRLDKIRCLFPLSLPIFFLLRILLYFWHHLF